MAVVIFGIVLLVAVFLWTFGSSLGFPGALVFLVAAGAMAGSLNELLLIILVGFVAAVLGDITAYTIARKASPTLSLWLKQLRFFMEGEKEAKEILKKYGFYSVFLTRFALMSLCAVVSYLAGFEKLNRRTFILGVVSGEILYACIFPIIGFVFKETWGDIVGIISDASLTLVLVVLVIFLVGVLYRKNKNKKK